MKRPTGVLRHLALAAALTGVGCGGAEEAPTPVQGHVYYQGRPVTRGTIVFVPDPDRGGHGPLARAEIRPDGGYALWTDSRAGAVPGWHKVTLVAVEIVTPSQGGAEYAEHRALVPVRYRDPDLSGLSFEVRAGQANVKDFYLD
jgi:hypothetical protein